MRSVHSEVRRLLGQLIRRETASQIYTIEESIKHELPTPKKHVLSNHDFLVTTYFAKSWDGYVDYEVTCLVCHGIGVKKGAYKLVRLA